MSTHRRIDRRNRDRRTHGQRISDGMHEAEDVPPGGPSMSERLNAGFRMLDGIDPWAECEEDEIPEQ
jgi:hypothetical protein